MNPGAFDELGSESKETPNQRYCFCLLWLHPSSEVLSYSDTPQHMIVKRELGPRADKASVCFASHRTLESRTKLQQFKHNSHGNVSARRWVRRTDSVGSSCAVPASKLMPVEPLKGDLQCSFRCYQCSERINTNLPLLLNRPKQAFYTSRRLRLFKVLF